MGGLCDIVCVGGDRRRGGGALGLVLEVGLELGLTLDGTGSGRTRN